MKKIILRKSAFSLLVLSVFVVFMLILTHPAQNGRQIEERLPDINEEPVYVECESGNALQISLKARESFEITGFQILVVNISPESRGTLHITLSDMSMQPLLSEVLPIETITPGKWMEINGNINFAEGQEYTLSILADGSEPYFMQVSKEEENEMPFEEKVFKNGMVLGCDISIGINQVKSVEMTYGDIFYYSIPVCLLLTVIFLICIWAGADRVYEIVCKIPLGKWSGRYGNEIFLILIFGYICINIYSRAYLKGVYISSDSAGYLREAVNLAAGNGFSYNALAGYRSWFANWPILYPALIAVIMTITGAEAYLASKILAMIMAGLILVTFRVCFGKDAWIYGICLTNIGYLNLSYYTWSEIPFMWFLLCFALVLGKILKDEYPSRKWYFMLGGFGLCCFLTRYYGIYVWIVTGLYILLLLIGYRKKREKELLCKALKMFITAIISGSFSLLYLLLNKIMNGMASGVSRSMWWDDYRILTDDLIESLLTEVFNVFSLQIPEFLEEFPFSLKLLVVVLVLAGIGWLVIRNCRHFSRESVLITMSVIYAVVFIAIRYVSSMDSFYFRFFEPGTFLLCVGLTGIILPFVKGKRGFRYFAILVTSLVTLSVLSVFENGGMDREDNYYHMLQQQWQDAYADIPEKSVVIFNDIDFRSSYYRPDVIDGMITPDDEFEDLKKTYYGSDYLCIRTEFAEVMLENGDYRKSVTKKLEEGISVSRKGEEFVVIALNTVKP